MPIERDEWHDLIRGRKDAFSGPVISMAIQPSPTGGSGTFLGADQDGVQWWVKPLNNPQGSRVPVTEEIVGAAGALIGAPVCECSIVSIPSELAGWEFRPGHGLESGLAHGSRAVGGATEIRTLLHRDRDDNASRHAGVVALHDWCWGDDLQWLYAQPEDLQLYSHDHGYYLPPGGPSWSEESLGASVDEPHPCPGDRAGLDRAELNQLAARLRALTRPDLAETLYRIPLSWSVTDSELETVGWFLERRAPAVAERLDDLGAGL